jgi:acetylornithine deacetylase
VIIGEPTDNRLVLSSRGALRVAYDFTGTTAHASAPDRGRNAVHHAARFIVAVEHYHRRLAGEGRAATCAATVVNGGTKLNVIPDHCRVLVDRRLAPSESAEDALRELEALLAALRDHDADVSWSWSRAGVWLEPFAISPESEFALRLLEALGQSAPGPMFPGGTDAPHFIAKGIPAAIIGPGSLDQAHSEDEWVRLDDLAAAIDIYERAALAFLLPPTRE